MDDNTSQQASPQSTSTIPHFCPICGALMTQQVYDDVLCWVCNECGFVDPV